MQGGGKTIHWNYLRKEACCNKQRNQKAGGEFQKLQAFRFLVVKVKLAGNG